ncbi:hypothetical protein MSAN_01245500 [Mycena sanguinolenta]|uniref:Uncharacterized protein n=1 Tax=Mycena sanguinolenta TaxID=230812 RepID=A0A8H6YIR9_9AGAR|nr:hypothetical protein MSAN_01245500 [Mycena sanguinolenta]
MPTLQARGAFDFSANIGLVVGLAIVGLLLIITFVVLVISVLQWRRAARKQSVPSSHELLTAKPKRVEKFYPVHRKASSESMGLLLQKPSTSWAPQVQAQPYGLHLPQYSYVGAEDEDHNVDPRIESGRSTPATRLPIPLALRVSIPQPAPAPPSERLSQPSVEPSSLGSSDSESAYSALSASTRMHTIDFASPPPPVPALPQHLRLHNEQQAEGRRDDPDRPRYISTPARVETIDLSSPSLESPIPSSPDPYPRPRSELPPEEPPLVRGGYRRCRQPPQIACQAAGEHTPAVGDADIPHRAR